MNKDFLRYLNSLPIYNLGHSIRKTEEGYFFKMYEKEIRYEDSLDVGIEDGLVSSLHLPNNRFRYGNEMLAYNQEKAKKYNRWDNFTQDDLQKPVSFQENSLNDIVLVHVYDHIQEPDKFFDAINKLQKKEGRLFFSGLSKYHVEYSIFYKLKKILKMTSFEEYAVELNKSLNQYNFVDEESLTKKLEENGYRLEKFHYFNRGSSFYMFFYDFFYYWFYKYKAEPLVNRMQIFPLMKNFYKWLFVSIEYPKYLALINNEGSEKGRDFFCYAIKK